MIYCSTCGKEIPADSQYCPFCGAHVPEVVNRTSSSEPVRTEKVITRPADVSHNFTTKKTINEFYKDAGFWGGLILIAGFFLPFFTKDGASLYDGVRTTMDTDKVILLWLIFPVSGLFMLLHSINTFPHFLAIFFSFFAVVALIYWGYVMFSDRMKYFGSEDFFTIIKTVGVGLWATVLGTILLLFHHRHIKVKVEKTKFVDRTL